MEVRDLDRFLPHRGPMVWVDQICQWDLQGGTSLIRLDPKAHYMDHEGVRQSSVVEWIAQTYGFVRACQSQAAQEPSDAEISRAYLVSFKNLSFSEKFEPALRSERFLSVYVRTLRDSNPLKTIYGEVKTSAGEKIAAGEITVYSD